jgi:tetratricopeptide (TPR) repeat protein
MSRLRACAAALALAATVAALHAVAAEPGPAAPEPRLPAPALPVPGADVPEARIDELPRGDVRRAELLLDLALRRHADAEAAEREELRLHAEAVARWRDAPVAAPAPPPLATPRADERRAEAVRLAERALEEGPPFRGAAEALFVAGLDAGRIGRGKDALRFLAELVRRHAASPLAQDAWLALAERRLADGDLTRARAAFEAAGRGERRDVRAFALARLAETALAAADPEGAAAALDAAVAAASTRALELLDRLVRDPAPLVPSSPATLRVAALAERTGDLVGARALRARLVHASGARTESAARPEPEGPGGLPLRRAGRGPADDDALVAARLGAATDDASSLQALGVAALDAGRPADAATLLQRAVSAGAPPQAAASGVDLAVALRAASDVEGARAAAARAAELEPTLAAAHEVLGALALARGDAVVAEAELARATGLEPARWQSMLLHALALAALGRDDEALAQADQVLDLETGQPAAVRLGFELRGKRAAAAAPAPAEGEAPAGGPR